MLEIKEEVFKLLCDDKSGHGIDHIERVLNLSLKFASKEGANKEITSLIALLHDVDDYKLFGIRNSEDLTNARRIMTDYNINSDMQNIIIPELNRIGYSKRLQGLEPTTLEGKIVSDADMCDGLGATGILRTHAFSLKTNRLFFDRKSFPIEDIDAETYMKNYSSSGVCHMFEKILKLKDLMLTDSGKEEAINRYKIVVDFLYNLFQEENATEWIEYLDNYQKRLVR